MALSSEFASKTENVVETLHQLVDDNQPWRSDLESALSMIDFTDAQKQAIREAATALTFQTIDQNENLSGFSTRLTHAFRDSIANAAMVLEMAAYEGNEAATLDSLVQIRGYIEDLQINYPRMLKGEVPESVESVLDRYKTEVLPQLNDMIDELATSTGIDPDTIKRNMNYQHITALPADIFADDFTT